MDLSHYSIHKNIGIPKKKNIELPKINSSRDILHFMSKCVNFVNSYLKEYLIKKSFIVML